MMERGTTGEHGRNNREAPEERTDLLHRFDRVFAGISRVSGRILSILLVLMVLNVFYDVIMRYFFHNSSVAMQEMEWHLFSIIILFGMSVALLEDGHVRVDFLYDRFRPRTKALINIVGTVCFLLPLALLVLFGSLEFVRDAYEINEISQDPGGLPYRWVVKGMIPLSFVFLIICAVGYTIKQINAYRDSAGEVAK